AVRFLAADDGYRQIGARRRGVDDPLGRRRVAHRRVVKPVARPHRPALEIGAAGDPLAWAPRAAARPLRRQRRAATGRARLARAALHVVEEDTDGVAAGQLQGLRGDDIEQALAIEAGGHLPRRCVEPRRLLLSGARGGVEAALFVRHREVLAERAERLVALPAGPAPAPPVFGP